MDALPAFYLPPDCQRPASCPPVGGCALDGPGPDGLPGGAVVGGIYRPGESGWRRSPAGWWIRPPATLRPQALRRLAAPACYVRWSVVPGVGPGHAWAVPIVIAPLRSGEAMTWAPVVDRVLGADGWTLGPAASLADRLLRLAESRAVEAPALSEGELIALAVDLLAVGHLVDRDTLVALEWLAESTILATIAAACGEVPDASV